MELTRLTQDIKEFTLARDWEQFHNPKDLALALGIEVAELQELMLWIPGANSLDRVNERRAEIEHEVGDILIYLLRFCQVTDIDPLEAAARKLKLNAEKYPVHTSRGNSKKYTEL